MKFWTVVKKLMLTPVLSIAPLTNV